MTEISESRTREIQHWLDDRLAEPDLPYQAMAMLRDAAALIRQLQAAEQAAWHAGLDAGREQGRSKDHAHQPPSVPVGAEWPLSLLRAGHWREAFAGREHCSDIPGIEADLHKIDTPLRDQEEDQ